MGVKAADGCLVLYVLFCSNVGGGLAVILSKISTSMFTILSSIIFLHSSLPLLSQGSDWTVLTTVHYASNHFSRKA